MKYYSPNRPLVPGAFPVPAGNKVKEVLNYGEKTRQEETNIWIWGWVEYEKELEPEAWKAYELIPEGYDYYTAVLIRESQDKRNAVVKETKLYAERPQDITKAGKVWNVTKKWFDSMSAAVEFCEAANA